MDAGEEQRKRRTHPPSTSMEAGEEQPKKRCPSSADGPTAHDIFSEFLDQDSLSKSMIRKYEEIIDLLAACVKREWCCSGCDYWEMSREYSRGGNAFTSTHGADKVLSHIDTFCTYFIIRKCAMDDSERRLACRCMKALIMFCDKKGYTPKGEDSKAILKAIAPGLTFSGEKIVDELHKLYVSNYWETLEEEYAKKQKSSGDSNGVNASQNEDFYREEFDSELPWKVTEISNEGWWISADMGMGDREYLIKLPDKVRKLGKVGMELSCMSIKELKDGSMKPYGAYGCPEYPCANVYPPSP